jgi:Rrf2 family protein
MYSRASRYAMKALAFMAKRENKSVDIQTIGKAAKVPTAYLAKIFQALVRSGVVSSRRGPNGGYTLSRDPRKITLLDVINAVDDPKSSLLSSCIMGLDYCGDENPCPLHEIWISAAKRMKKQLQQSTVHDIPNLSRRLHPFSKSRRVLSAQLRSIFK